MLLQSARTLPERQLMRLNGVARMRNTEWLAPCGTCGKGIPTNEELNQSIWVSGSVFCPGECEVVGKQRARERLEKLAQTWRTAADRRTADGRWSREIEEGAPVQLHEPDPFTGDDQ